MNWLDRTIGYLSPEAGARRLRGRVALATMQQLASRLGTRAYEGAKAGRRTGGWTASGTSANAEVAPALSTLRNRCREQVRNNPYAASAIARLTAKSVGTGIIARPEKSIAKAYKAWVEEADFEGHFDLYGLQNLWARTAFESGEVIIRRVRTNSGFGLKLQTLEPDYLDTTKFGQVANGNMVIAGVEIDRQGRRQAFHLYDQHPGESNLTLQSFESKRVPADDVILFGEKLRPGQLRYVPRLAVSLIKMRDLDEFEEAELVRKKIEACFVAFVTGAGDSETLAAESATNASTGRLEETLSPGMIKYLKEGTAVEFGTPSGTSDVAFSKRHLHAIAVGTGLSYELLTGDLTEVNFSSIRQGVQDFRDLVDSWRWLHFIPVVCLRTARWWEEAAWTAGKIRSTGYNWTWTPPRWPYVKPSEDIAALKDEIRCGLKSQSEGVRELGYEPEEVWQELAADRETLAKLNLVVDTDPGVEQKAAADQAAAQAEQDAAGQKADDEKAAKAAHLQAEHFERMETRQGELFALLSREKPAPVINVAPPVVTIADGAIRSGDTNVSIPERQVTLEAHMPEVQNEVRVEAPQITVRAYPAESEENITRDARNEISRVHRKNKD